MKEHTITARRAGAVPSETYPGGEIHWLVSGKATGAKELTLGQTLIDVGQRNPRHRHPNCEEALYVLAGTIEHVIEGTPSVVMTAGDAICVPRGAWHQAINIGPEPVRLLVSFSSADRETVVDDAPDAGKPAPPAE